MSKYIYYICIVAVILSACGQNKKLPTREYYAGEFIYFADAATIKDCATGVTFPVSHEGNYLKAEQQYSDMNAHGEPVYIEFFGHLITEPSMEDGMTQNALVIDSLIRFDRESACDISYQVAGVYEGTDNEGKYVVKLKPDYTFTQSFFPTNAPEQNAAGRWYSAALAEIVVLYEEPKVKGITFEIIPSQNALVLNSGGKPLVLSKVFLN